MSVEELVAKRIAGLSDPSQRMVETVLEACKAKKVVTLKELEYDYKKYVNTMIKDGMHSKRDVETLLSSFFTALQGTVQKDLRYQTNVQAELCAQLFACANAKGVSVDPPRIHGAIQDTTPSFLQKDTLLKPANKLQSLESVTADDAKVNEEIKAVEKQNARQQEKIERITAQFQEMMIAKAQLGQDLQAAKAEIAELKEKNDCPNPSEVAALQQEIKKLKAEHEEAKKALSAKLNESPQFVNLKKMIAKKNEDLAKLREQLQNHELVYAEDEDDPDF
eukprot:TRINITY_DN22280_c0_g1_i1.p1 TRINITY_DN22280_c0_g1~~TRINITY_DN22280_c0_g1_i1.p1  ORF type:complete len:278 (+),score=101.42 TRINITY_DN22280_c0_g1_i1:80-913(+)